MKYQVAEKFVSINGEGRRAGQLAVFIRLKGCNLNCSYCDTAWANQQDTKFEWITEEEIYRYIKEQKVKNVTLTGGEPLLSLNVRVLLERLAEDPELRVEIETNGSIPLAPYTDIEHGPSFTMDYKLGESNMTDKMCLENFRHLKEKDTVKFVAGSIDDLKQAEEIIDQYHLTEKCSVYISPVFGKIEPKEIVAFMAERHMNDVNLQLQLHKFIWDPQERGV